MLKGGCCAVPRMKSWAVRCFRLVIVIIEEVWGVVYLSNNASPSRGPSVERKHVSGAFRRVHEPNTTPRHWKHPYSTIVKSCVTSIGQYVELRAPASLSLAQPILGRLATTITCPSRAHCRKEGRTRKSQRLAGAEWWVGGPDADAGR